MIRFRPRRTAAARLAGCAVLAGLLVAQATSAAPLWLGPWLLAPPPPEGLTVTRPATGVPGAVLRVAPSGNGPPVGLVRATFDFVDLAFDGGTARVELAAAPTAVHAQVRVDDQLVAALGAAGQHVLTLPAGDSVVLEVQALDAAAADWHVTLDGLVVQKAGWTLTYSHDVAGLRAVVPGADAVVLAVDPDWAELGWPLAGTVAASRRLDGHVLTAQVTQALPPDGLKALLALDDVPQLVPQAGPLQLDVADARTLALVLHATAALPGEAAWQVGLQQLRLDDTAVAAPGAPTSTGGSGPGGSGGAVGCAAQVGRSPMTTRPSFTQAALLLVLCGLIVASSRRLHGQGMHR